MTADSSTVEPDVTHVLIKGTCHICWIQILEEEVMKSRKVAQKFVKTHGRSVDDDAGSYLP